MSEVDVNKLKDPFVWLEPIGDCDAEEKPFGFENPLRAFYEEIAPPLVEKPKAPRTPLAPIRTSTWDPSSGMKGAKYPTFVLFHSPELHLLLLLKPEFLVVNKERTPW